MKNTLATVIGYMSIILGSAFVGHISATQQYPEVFFLALSALVAGLFILVTRGENAKTK